MRDLWHSTNDLRQAQFTPSSDDFRAQAAQARDMPKIEAVAIDTLDTLQQVRLAGRSLVVSEALDVLARRIGWRT